MLGYCSNSPNRCSLAKNITIIESTDNVCPKCDYMLLPARAPAETMSVKLSGKILHFSLFILMLAMLSTTYVSYLFK